MRRLGLLMLATVVVGCSSERKEPDEGRPLTEPETASMPMIGIEEVVGKLKTPDGRARLIVFWSAAREDAAACLAQADEVAARHAQEAIEVLALNVDMPEVVREQALPLVAKLKLKALEPRAFQGDVEGLGATLDYAWGGQTPAAFLYGRDGKQAYKGYGKDAVREAAAKVPALLATPKTPSGG